MKKQHLIPTAILGTFLLATSPVMASSLADVNISSAGVDFQVTSILGGSYTLTVSSPGDYRSEQNFAAGEAPSFSAFDKAGQALAAGTYTWTLTHNPAAGDDREVAVKREAQRQTGSFTIEAGGSLANPNLIEDLNKAQVFITDLIVQSSACVGVDCTSTESFGFDALRLKENNLRIHFDDTSTTGSFASNDWRLTANDSSNGGANYFSIDDATAGKTPFRVEAGAPANTLYVDSEGRIGIQTATPVVGIHHVDGNTPTLRLEQDGSDGFASQTWDLAGNEANFFIRDVTTGSKLPFRIKPGAPTDAMYIAASGDVGMGTDSPSDELHVRRTDDNSTKILIENTNANANTVGVDMTSAAGSYSTRVTNAGDFAIRNLATSNNLTFASDGALTLPAIAAAPTSCSNGSMYTDDSGALCVCFSGAWSRMAGTGTCS
ncbi:MAG: hypothetical protein AAF560_28230 [Acidobacteriota bacterium]